MAEAQAHEVGDRHEARVVLVRQLLERDPAARPSARHVADVLEAQVAALSRAPSTR